MIETVGFILLTIIDLAGAIFFIGAIFTRSVMKLSALYKFAIILAVFGLLWQASRNYIYLSTGVSPMDVTSPLWALKDIALVLIAFETLRHWNLSRGKWRGPKPEEKP